MQKFNQRPGGDFLVETLGRVCPPFRAPYVRDRYRTTNVETLVLRFLRAEYRCYRPSKEVIYLQLFIQMRDKHST